MKINSRYMIEALDERSMALFRQSITTDPEDGTQRELWRPVAYAGSVKTMLEILVRREINGTGLKDLHDIYEKIEELNLTIRTLCGENMDKVAYDELVERMESEGKKPKIEIIEKSNKKKKRKK